MSYVPLLLADGKISIVCELLPSFCDNYKNHTLRMDVAKCIYLFCIRGSQLLRDYLLFIADV